MTRSSPLFLLVAAALSGCVVGPNYRQPDIATPAGFSSTQALPQGSVTGSAANIDAWWMQFDDAELNALIEHAMRGNLDLHAAASRIREAREQLIIAGANRLPQINADADASKLHVSQNSGFGELASLIGGGPTGGGGASNGLALPGGNITTYTIGFDASWEIDLFGGTRRAIEGARAGAEQAVWNERDSEVSVAAEVANDYWLLRSLQRQSAVAADEVERQKQMLALTRARHQFGFVTEQDVHAQGAQLAAVKATLPDLNAQQAAQLHALGVLLGEAPEVLQGELSAPKPLSRPPASVPVGLPADLLRRRPDIRAAERALAAASARIGVAVADLYPKINLTGTLDLVSLDLTHLLEASSRQYDLAGALSWPLLSGGRGQANIRVAKEEDLQALDAYRKTVLEALQDVEDALVRYGDELRKNQALRDESTEAQRATDIAQAEYRAGTIDITAVLNAEGAVLQAQSQLAQSDGTLDRDLVSIYKALGGGWRGSSSP